MVKFTLNMSRLENSMILRLEISDLGGTFY